MSNPLKRDGLVSSSLVAVNLSTLSDSVTVLKKKFSDKGLTARNACPFHFVVITVDFPKIIIFCWFFFWHLGSHKMGQIDCQFFSNLLYNFTSTCNTYPKINTTYLSYLQSECPSCAEGSKRIALDKGSSMTFNATFFRNVRDGNCYPWVRS